MHKAKGYTLRQLLEWSLEDRLIDGYQHTGDRLIIFQGAERRSFSLEEARSFLKRTFKAVEAAAPSAALARVRV